MTIDIGGSFDKTLSRFGINATWLSRESGVNAQMISRFRNDKEIQTDTLEKLLEPLPMEVKEYFFALLLGQQVKAKVEQDRKVDLEKLVDELDSDELAGLIYLISGRLVKRKKATESKTKLIAS
jgi:DNA-binding Xre family transcriptional regulator